LSLLSSPYLLEETQGQSKLQEEEGFTDEGFYAFAAARLVAFHDMSDLHEKRMLREAMKEKADRERALQQAKARVWKHLQWGIEVRISFL
jgi:hypothetical protein